MQDPDENHRNSLETEHFTEETILVLSTQTMTTSVTTVRTTLVTGEDQASKGRDVVQAFSVVLGTIFLFSFLPLFFGTKWVNRHILNELLVTTLNCCLFGTISSIDYNHDPNYWDDFCLGITIAASVNIVYMLLFGKHIGLFSLVCKRTEDGSNAPNDVPSSSTGASGSIQTSDQDLPPTYADSTVCARKVSAAQLPPSYEEAIKID